MKVARIGHDIELDRPIDYQHRDDALAIALAHRARRAAALITLHARLERAAAAPDEQKLLTGDEGVENICRVGIMLDLYDQLIVVERPLARAFEADLQ